MLKQSVNHPNWIMLCKAAMTDSTNVKNMKKILPYL